MSPNPDRPLDPAQLLQQALAVDAPPPWPAPALDVLAKAFPELRLEVRIGQGGMAAVYRAVQTKLDRRVALKVLRPDLSQQPEFVDRFLREAKTMAQLNHPHVLAVHDFGERDGFCYLLVEYVDGANLRELMAMGRLSPAEALRIVPQICAGLQFAHDHGIVHRDVKPENVLVDRQGQVKLADFGLAKLLGSESVPLTRPSMVFGTPHYMAPEQWQGSSQVDHRADIYSLGVVLYELLTGKLPVGTYEPASKCKGVPAGVDQVVHRSLEHEPARRYQQVRDVQRDLERQEPVTAAGQRPPADAAHLRRRGWQWFLAALLVLLVAGAGFVEFGQLQMQRSASSAQRPEEVAHHMALLQAIRASLDQGRPWTGEVPRRFEQDTVPPLGDGLRTALQLGWVTSLLLVVGLLLWRAQQCALAHAQSRVQMFLFTAPNLAVPLVLVAHLLFELAGHSSLARVIAGIFVLVGNAAVLVWLWHGTARRTPRALGPTGLAYRVLLVLACLALIAVAATASWLHAITPRNGWVARSAPVPAKALLGKSRAEVLEWLGPPIAITVEESRWHFSYRGLDATTVSTALTLQGGRVIATSSLPTLLVPEREPEGAFPGMTSAALADRLGIPMVIDNQARWQVLTFAGGTVVRLLDGVVVRIEKEK